MQRYFFSLRIALLVILAAIAVASIDLWWRGFAVVYDPGDRLARAAIVDSGGVERPMREFATGYWAGRARSDGAFLITCEGGEQRRVGYVTPGTQVTYEVMPRDCLAAPSGVAAASPAA